MDVMGQEDKKAIKDLMENKDLLENGSEILMDGKTNTDEKFLSNKNVCVRV